MATKTVTPLPSKSYSNSVDIVDAAEEDISDWWVMQEKEEEEE